MYSIFKFKYFKITNNYQHMENNNKDQWKDH